MNVAVSDKYNNFLAFSSQLLIPHWHEENALKAVPFNASRKRKKSQNLLFLSLSRVISKCQLVPRTGEYSFSMAEVEN